MILRKLHIENFGKLHNLTIELKSGLNEFYYENGFGKTSLTIFIKVMFYGMPPARENVKMERKKYVDYIKAIGIILVVVGHVNFANSEDILNLNKRKLLID